MTDQFNPENNRFQPNSKRGYDTNSSYRQTTYPQDSFSSQYGNTVSPYAPNHPQSTTVLILGIISLIIFQPLGIVTLIIGNKARKEIRQYPGAYGKSTMLTVGWGLGIAATVLFCIGIVLLVITIFLAISGPMDY
ncbi:DUF4190 domain-containing protein [Propionimicrobium lymphophilum]|uniref:DUF4190 domain-containing protein n=1 Tax=Propionimicrobium lymphophilum TaxID=33012 RepID=UPI003EC79BFF